MFDAMGIGQKHDDEQNNETLIETMILSQY